MKKLLLISILTFSWGLVQSQDQVTSVKIGCKKGQRNTVGVPFDSVIVLDNRFDTAAIRYTLDGEYPVRSENFHQPLPAAIKNYLDKAIKPLEKRSETLLVDLHQLKVSNRNTPVWDTIRNRYLFLRIYVIFEADVYIEQPGNLWRKIVSIQKPYVINYEPVGCTISRALNEMTEATSFTGLADRTNKKRLSYLLKDTQSFRFSTDSILVPLSAIDVPFYKHWKKYPIILDQVSSNGFFNTFGDFQQNKINACSPKLIFNNADSTYRYTKTDCKFIKSPVPWAISDGGRIYINIYKDLFLPLHRHENTFYFIVPGSLPDMYAFLSMQETERINRTQTNASGNLLGDLVSTFLDDTIQSKMKKARQKKMAYNGLNGQYRICFVDMQNGDIVFTGDAIISKK